MGENYPFGDVSSSPKIVGGRLHRALDDLGQPPTWPMSDAQLALAAEELARGIARLQGHLLAVTAEADRNDTAAKAGATGTAGWVRGATGLSGPESSRVVRDARAVVAHEPVHDALVAGEVHLEQAREIAVAVDALPAEHRDAARTHLLGCAAEHDSTALRVLGRHVLEVVAPEVADAHLAKRLAAEEREARRRSYVKTWSDGHGSRYIKAKVPELHGCMLDAMLDGIANPARPDAIPREGSSSPQVRGQAFCELLERYPVETLPTSGGVSPRVVVTMTLETLLGGLRAACVLGTGHRLSPGEARRLASAAGVIPAVLDGTSQLLDLGRRRGFSEPQRTAMALRQDGFCNIRGCDRPATWADGNHRIPYSQGGRTTLENGELICPRHHTLVHQDFDYPRRT